jgi:hypothetical protein
MKLYLSPLDVLALAQRSSSRSTSGQHETGLRWQAHSQIPKLTPSGKKAVMVQARGKAARYADRAKFEQAATKEGRLKDLLQPRLGGVAGLAEVDWTGKTKG